MLEQWFKHYTYPDPADFLDLYSPTDWDEDPIWYYYYWMEAPRDVFDYPDPAFEREQIWS